MAAVELLTPERIHTGAGSARALGAELAARRSTRALVLTGATLGAADGDRASAAERLATHADGRVAGIFAGIGQHNPRPGVEAAMRRSLELDADALVAFGGGSPIDAAKAVSLLRAQAGHAPLPIVAVPTTLSAAEWACSFGMTDPVSRTKGGFRDRALLPVALVLDPELSESTPEWLWYGSGMRALDHAVEAICADNAHPWFDALAASAITDLYQLLPKSTGTAGAGARERLLLAAGRAHAGSLHINWGLSHQLGRQLGSLHGVPHGHTSAVLLWAVLAVEGDQKRSRQATALAAVPPGQRRQDLSTTVREFARELGLPTTLSELGIASVPELEVSAEARRVLEVSA
ncbi:MAG: iron-containing alcohol dehydrogenase [Candidatus Dormibacteria bacterium]